MRLIDADLLKRNIAKWLQGGDPQETEMVKLDDIAISVIMEIEEQPTAYNPEKVVEELENDENQMTFGGIPFREPLIKVADAIDIVKRG